MVARNTLRTMINHHVKTIKIPRNSSHVIYISFVCMYCFIYMKLLLLYSKTTFIYSRGLSAIVVKIYEAKKYEREIACNFIRVIGPL